jgi:hypothetical protein
MPDDRRQFETIALIRGYAAQILNENPLDTQPDTAKRIEAAIVRMAQLRSQLDRGQRPSEAAAKIMVPVETKPSRPALIPQHNGFDHMVIHAITAFTD